jgi:hypothetical protein
MSGIIDWAEVVTTFCYDEELVLIKRGEPLDIFRYNASYDLVGHFTAKSLARLGRNLAAAGALERAFTLGERYGTRFGNENGFWDSEPPWWPNVDGKAAP